MSDSSPTTGPASPPAASTAPQVGPDDFARIDLRVGTVVSAAPFPEARTPSLRVRVDLGPELGIRETSARITNYTPDELVGRSVVAAVNLGERRIAGFASQFLLLGGLADDGTVALLQPDTPLPPGSVVA